MTKKRPTVPSSNSRIGATHRYPYGKVDDSDEGELQLAIFHDSQNGIVRVEFGKPIKWLGLSSREARDVAVLLIQHADHVDRAKA